MLGIIKEHIIYMVQVTQIYQCLGKGTFAHWKAIEYFVKQKIFFIDFEGVNSPKRGWFKIGFGGDN